MFDEEKAATRTDASNIILRLNVYEDFSSHLQTRANKHSKQDNATIRLDIPEYKCIESRQNLNLIFKFATPRTTPRIKKNTKVCQEEEKRKEKQRTLNKEITIERRTFPSLKLEA